jgi:hypothetical protein
VINATIAIAAESWRLSRAYTVLMIVTDGEICDESDTIAAIVDACKHPLSILIVGVGSANFSTMDVLDGDGAILRGRKGEFATRDIVQFVPVIQFKDKQEQLAAEVLAEIPNQLHEFCAGIEFRPGC